MAYRMRNDLVLVRKQRRNKVRGIIMPEKSAEGMDFFVAGLGPNVVDLSIGDQVMLMGEGMSKFYPVPGDSSLLVCEQKLVAYVLTSDEEVTN